MKSAVELAMGRQCCRRLSDHQRHKIAVLDTEWRAKLDQVTSEYKLKIQGAEMEGDYEKAEALRRQMLGRRAAITTERNQLADAIRGEDDGRSTNSALAGK